jgi:hypothetical protein
LTALSLLLIHAFTYRKRARETGLAWALLFPSFEKGVKAHKTKALADDITLERHKDFGASAPMTSPQKTGFAHPPATASEAKAAFILNG